MIDSLLNWETASLATGRMVAFKPKRVQETKCKRKVGNHECQGFEGLSRAFEEFPDSVTLANEYFVLIINYKVASRAHHQLRVQASKLPDR